MKSKRSFFLFIITIILITALTGCKQSNNLYTRGVGVYPGSPKEDFSPRLMNNSNERRNLARQRAAYHSSSYDYNLTAQLVTDGIIETSMPGYIIISTNSGIIPKNKSECLPDRKSFTEI